MHQTFGMTIGIVGGSGKKRIDKTSRRVRRGPKGKKKPKKVRIELVAGGEISSRTVTDYRDCGVAVEFRLHYKKKGARYVAFVRGYNPNNPSGLVTITLK